MKTFQKIMGKIVNLLIILVIIAIIFCLYFIITIKVFHKQYINFFGYSIFEVATGSMQKTINIGDAVLIKIDSDYKVDDIVTYKNGNDFITHRVVSIEDDYIITKGDNNNVNDNPIDKGLVVGKVVKILPKVGIWKKVLLTPKVIVLIVLTLFIFSVLFSYDGKSIKIISSKKAQEEIDNKVNDEVNKKMEVMKRKKRRSSKKVLDATQIIDVNEIKKELSKEKNSKKAYNKEKKKLEATQIIDVKEIKKRVNENEKV